MKIMHRCFTGRRWIDLGIFSIGFGPRQFIEQVWIFRRKLYDARKKLGPAR